jgi:hypothetical protein
MMCDNPDERNENRIRENSFADEAEARQASRELDLILSDRY